MTALSLVSWLVLVANPPQEESSGTSQGSAPQTGTPIGTARSPLSSLRPDAATQEGSEPEPLGHGGGDKLELSLEEFVRAVLERNLSLKIAELDNAATATGVMAALGTFDPELYATVVGSESETPTASAFQAPKNQSLNANTGLRGILRNGLQYDLNYNMNYNRQSPGNPFFGLNPTLSSTLGASLTQPLLRNFGTTVTEAPVVQAQFLVARGDLDLYQRVQEMAFQAVESYWTFVRTLRERDTATTAYDVAEELVRNSEKRHEAGVLTRLDVLTAQTESARRKEELIRAQNAADRAEDALKLLLSPGVTPSDWQLPIQPTTPAQLRDEPLPDVEQAAVEAFLERSDLRALEVDLKNADLSLEVAGNQQLPRLDLLGSYGYAGLAGKQPGGASKNNLDLWGNSLEPIRDREFRSWSVGFDFSHPLGNRTADANERRARIDKERAYMVWLEKRMNIVQELRGALRDVADAKAATVASTQGRVLAEQQYQAQMIRLENQHATTFQVRESQRDLFEAQNRETVSIIQYEILLAAVERARGRLAQKYGVQWLPEILPEGALLH